MTDIDRPFDSLAPPCFCGVATFMRLPQAASADGLDVAMRGLPSDNGSRFAPAPGLARRPSAVPP